jgi:hypothetical protein
LNYKNYNEALIRTIALALGELNEKVVYVASIGILPSLGISLEF